MHLKVLSDLPHGWDKYTHKPVPWLLTFTIYWIVVSMSRERTLCAIHHFCHIFMVMIIIAGDEVAETRPSVLKNNFTTVILKTKGHPG